jgi:beta-mannosidase
MPKIVTDITKQWEFAEYPVSARNMNDLESAKWHKTSVPTSIFLSLIEAGLIEQKDLLANPENYTWVSDKPWMFRKSFEVSQDILDRDRIDLVFDGLDTVATVWLNEKQIAKTNNMFMPFRFDVTKKLKPCQNTILIKFDPADQYAQKLHQRYSRSKDESVSSPHKVYIRKAQYQFGSDFSPPLPGCGIFRPVRIEAVTQARIEEVHVRTIDCNENYADIKVAVKIKSCKKNRYLCNLKISSEDQKNQHQIAFNKGDDFHSTIIRIDKPHLWWPAGYGPQNIYNLEIELLCEDEILDNLQKQIGLRLVKLNQSKEKYGHDFQLEINSQPIYVKGASWLPATMFPGSLAKCDYEKLLKMAAQANINMLRVCAEGIYESEEFYDLCDQLGIMVWQDFMFANALYPEDTWFVKEVSAEAKEILRRIRSHPCLVLFCGNSQIDWLNYMKKKDSKKKYQGKEIFHKILPEIVSEFDQDSVYIPTTPFTRGKNPNDCDSGTTHQWQFWQLNQPLHQFCKDEIPTFVAEFATQSLPCYSSLKSITQPEKIHIGSWDIEKHNYYFHGNSRIYRFVGDLFAAAPTLEDFIYLSQLSQARAAKTYVEYLRANSYKNKGILFSHFNECFPAISFSSIDFSAEPKSLYYYTKRFFNDVIIAAAADYENTRQNDYPQLNSLQYIVINDSPDPVTAFLNCTLMDLGGNKIDKVELPLSIGPFSGSRPIKIPKAMMSPQYPQNEFLYLSLQNEDTQIAQNIFFYLPDKYIQWQKPKIEKNLSKLDHCRYQISLSSDTMVRDLQISADQRIEYEDNYIDLIPGKERKIIMKADKETLKEPDITLRSFRHTEKC